MGRTHEALKRAEEQYGKHLLRASQTPHTKGMATNLERSSARNHMDRHEDIKSNLLARGSDGSIKSVLFINTSNRGKSTDHAIRFAASLAEDLRLKVLLIDLNLWTLSLYEVFRIDHALGLSDLFSHSSKMASPIKKVGPGNLYTVRLGGAYSGFGDLFKSGVFDKLLKNMCERFDYLILDAPAIASFWEYRILCSKVDAVVLSMESDKIAGQVALSAKKHLENPADKLLGVVSNKT